MLIQNDLSKGWSSPRKKKWTHDGYESWGCGDDYVRMISSPPPLLLFEYD